MKGLKQTRTLPVVGPKQLGLVMTSSCHGSTPHPNPYPKGPIPLATCIPRERGFKTEGARTLRKPTPRAAQKRPDRRLNKRLEMGQNDQGWRGCMLLARRASNG